MEYQKFLKNKKLVVPSSGISVQDSDIHPMLFPFQRDLVRWALRKGRAAIFADTGLGKTFMQLEWARLTGGRVLIIAPLSVARQTVAEGQKIDVDVKYVRSQSEITDGLNITNYEMIEHFEPTAFKTVVLDESSILKGLDGKTRQKLTEMFRNTPYKLCCTATPAPNDIAEIANHAEFLGIMTRTDMLATFFVHDDQGWRLKGHAQEPFFQWLASWGMSVKKPSDLGYDDDGFILPELRISPVFVDVDYRPPGQLFWDGKLKGIQDRTNVRKTMIEVRVQRTAELVNSDSEQWICWVGLNEEGRVLYRLIPDSVLVEGQQSIADKLEAIEGFQDGRYRVLITKPKIAGFGMNFQHAHKMAFVGLSDSWESYYQCIRRCWRFGQTKPVDVYIVLSEPERAIYENVLRKEEEARKMSEHLIANVQQFERAEIADTGTDWTYETDEAQGKGYRLLLGDSAERLKEIPSDSIHLSVFSPPFLSLYTYSPTERDLGNSRNEKEFFAHFGFIIDELLRVTLPGRNCCVHVSQVPAMLVRDGYIGIKDFRGKTIDAFENHGWIYHGEVCIDKDPQALAHGTSVLTPSGWRPIETLQIDDYVIGANGKPTKVIGVWPQGVRPVYRITFSDGTSVRCDGAHLWTVRPMGRKWQSEPDRQWEARRTDELYGNLFTPKGIARYEIPVLTAPVEFQTCGHLPIDPYVLGVLLGDGCFAARSSVDFIAEHRVAALVAERLAPTGVLVTRRPYGERRGVARYAITHPDWHKNPVLHGLRQLGLETCRAWEKLIPLSYKLACPQDRLNLLRGLMDTDGTCKKNGAAFFSTVSEVLAHDVVEIVQGLGGLATIRMEDPQYRYNGEIRHGRRRYVVSISLPGHLNPFSLESKAERWHHRRSITRRIIAIEPDGEAPCTCITVDAEDGLFVIEHGIITHNCQAIRTKAKALLFTQLRKDASWLRPALADYILVFRKPGENPVPIKPDLTNDEWIEWARPVWYGIRESDTLNVAEARESDDERHICPLQLGTIERCIRLWSNPGETVLSPFAGIGSEGYVALQHGRKFIGIELKRSYWEVAKRNLERASQGKQQLSLFETA